MFDMLTCAVHSFSDKSYSDVMEVNKAQQDSYSVLLMLRVGISNDDMELQNFILIMLPTKELQLVILLFLIGSV